MGNELISIIIPVYNGERYIDECFDSILNQTYKNLEIIVINDGSTDGTQSVIDNYKKKNNFIFDYYQENCGQGVARNKGLSYAKGEYVAFIDADDIIHEKFIEVLYESIKKYNSDFAICDWKYYYNNGTTKYTNENKFMGYPLLKGENTELILEASVYFTVNKLYRRTFLLKNNIKYGEGYIYEDVEFYIKSCSYANKVSTVHNPYYFVRVNQHSTTKTNYNSNLHYDSFLKAISNSLNNLKLVNIYGYYYVYRYFINRSFIYSNKRMPTSMRKQFIIDVFALLNKYNYNIKVPSLARRRNRLIFNKILPNNNVVGFIFINNITRNKKIKKIIGLIKGINMKAILANIKKKYYLKQLKKPIYNDVVLFYGFDNRYVGNSKYFFSYLINEYPKLQVYFITNSKSITTKHRISSNSFRFWRLMARSRNLVFESWIPLKYRKRKGTNWIQLWHGTPIKKMLFDSNEPFFSVSNPKHKLNKYKDIRRWDYLICENYSNKNYFKEAFLIDNKKILAYGYPRVKYLLDNINNISKKLEIKKLLNIPRNKKIIFYAPTWRDYNYGNKKPCFKYLLNLQELKNNISSDYVIVLKNHAFLDSGLLLEGIINISHEVETQDLLLISDILISDYSSIIFDYIAIDKPIILYANDIERYQECRGLYPAVWKELDFAVCTEFNQVIDIINMVDNNKYPYDKISYIKKNYCCQNIDYCYQNIYKLLK